MSSQLDADDFSSEIHQTLSYLSNSILILNVERLLKSHSPWLREKADKHHRSVLSRVPGVFVVSMFCLHFCFQSLAESLSVPGKPPGCVGILKTPGRRKLSSNNRVEFLDNLQEKEIPGRHAWGVAGRLNHHLKSENYNIISCKNNLNLLVMLMPCSKNTLYLILISTDAQMSGLIIWWI